MAFSPVATRALLKATHAMRAALDVLNVAHSHHEAPARPMRSVSAAKGRGMEPTVANFIIILVANLTQYDMKVSMKEAMRGRSNIHRLALLLKAVSKVEDDLKGKEKSKEPADLEALKASINEHFNAGFPPTKKTIKTIDLGLAGKKVSYPVTQETKDAVAAEEAGEAAAE